MLLELKVSNYALIEDLTLSFGAGLNVLSGETGAGKSIVIGAINLLLGERATTEQIRQGENRTYIEGIFNPQGNVRKALWPVLQEAGLDDEGDLIIAREVSRSGRSTARVNGRAVPLSFLRDLGCLLVDLHGQHQHQSLLRPEEHHKLLDSFGGEAIAAVISAVSELYGRRRVLLQELVALGDSAAGRERKLDINAFQLQEITAAGLVAGEDEELTRRIKVLANAERLYQIVSDAYRDLYTGAEEGVGEALLDRLKSSRQGLREALTYDDQALAAPLELVEGATAQLEEVALDLRDYLTGLEFDPTELAALQDRLDLINNLKKKYGPALDDVLSFAKQAESEIERLRNSEEVATRLEQEISNLEQELLEKSDLLSELRRQTAVELEGLLQGCLAELALPEARFAVKIESGSELTPRGSDRVEFLFSANKGEAVKPLAKIISGGEVSRVMLALKSILANQDLVPTLIFDEVDAGIGGVTIQSVAEKLSRLAANHQVMCVTHSPQIASMADYHYQLYKEQHGERTLTRATFLAEKERRAELARMLDGASADPVSLQHVDSLLKRATNFREKEKQPREES